MAKTALRGIARVGDEDMFLPAWWFEPFGLSMRDFLASRDFQALIARLRPDEGCGANRTFKPLPLAEDEPKAVMAVAPGFRCGLAVALRLTAQANEMAALWPFVSDGSQHDGVAIDEVILAPDRLQALVQVTLPSGLQLTWHDTHFAANRGFYGEGSVHSVILSGIVHQLTAVQNTPIEIAADNPAWNAVRARSAEGFNADGSITIQTTGMSMIMPGNKDAPEFHVMQGPVRRVQPRFTEMFGQVVHLVTIAVMRDPDVVLPLHLTDAVLDGRPLPTVGDDFGAAARLVGRIWQPNLQRTGQER